MLMFLQQHSRALLQLVWSLIIVRVRVWVDLENSIITAATDWAAYIPVHVGLQYYSNREKFRDENGHVNIKAFTKDMLKIYKTYIPSIFLFYAIAGPAHNLCLKLGLDGDSATNTSYWGTMMITRALHTYNLWRADKKDKKTGDYKISKM